MAAPPQSLRWRLPIVLPVLLAAGLVAIVAVQATRAVQENRRVAAKAIRDYAQFAAWQFTRRASDYLRLTVITELRGSGAQSKPPITCRIVDDRVIVDRNATSASNRTIVDAITPLLSRRETLAIGLVALPGSDAFLGYDLRREQPGGWTACAGTVFTPAQLVPVFEHIIGFAPLLPPSLVSRAATNSLVDVDLSAADGTHLASLGSHEDGVVAHDTLGPNLSGIQVTATLHDAAIARLLAGEIPSGSSGLIGALLAVALVLCVVAVLQLRRTNEIIRLRGDFVAGVSHELKTPLAQISLFADTLARREHSPELRRQYLSIISREARRLGLLVDRLLHFAGLMRSEMTARDAREPSFLGEEVRAAVEVIQPLADARTLTILIDVPDEIELPLDRDGFRQVVLNLLDNAIKFSPEGQVIRIAARVHGGTAIVDVDDAGAGIAVAERERVFEAFVRGRGAERRGAAGGTGIGLAVVREIVRAHAGSVELMTSPLGGARARVELPAARMASHSAVER